MTISKAEAEAYFQRWTQVEAIEIAELLRTSMQTKLQQLASLMESRALFGQDPQRDEQIEQVRDRWARLRKALNE